MKHAGKKYKFTQEGRRAVEELTETMHYLRHKFGTLPNYNLADRKYTRDADDPNKILFYGALECIWNGRSMDHWTDFYESNRSVPSSQRESVLGPVIEVESKSFTQFYHLEDEHIDEALDIALNEKWIVSEFSIPFEFDNLEEAAEAGKLLVARLQSDCGGSWVHEIINMNQPDTYRVKANLVGSHNEKLIVWHIEQDVWCTIVKNVEHNIDFDGPNSSTPEGSVTACLEKYNKVLADQKRSIDNIYSLLKSKY